MKPIISTVSFISPVDPPSIETSLPPKKHSSLRLSSLSHPLPSPYSLLCSHTPFTKSSRLCGKKKQTPHPLSRLSSPSNVKFKFEALFFHPPLSQMAAALLRSLFGNSQSTTPAHGKAKTRSRTESTPAPSLYYVYTPPQGNTPSTSSSLGKEHRTNSQNTPVVSSSPLRYPTYDSRRSHEPSRPPLYRAASHRHHPDMNGS